MQRLFPRLNKTAFFIVTVVLMAIFTHTTATFASSADYAIYKNLFTGSTLTYSGPLLDTTKTKVPGFQFNVDINFSSGDQKILADDWAHVNDPSGTSTPDPAFPLTLPNGQDTFLIQSCLASDGSHCAYARIPYDTSPSASFWAGAGKIFNYATYIVPLVRGETDIASYLLSGSTITTKINTIYNASLEGNFTQTSPLTILQKAANGQYLQSQEVGVIGTQWYLADGTSVAVSDFIGSTARTANIWYCARQAGTDSDPTQAYKNKDPDDTSIAQFSGFCNGASYFKIADIQGQITPPQSAAAAVAQNKAIVPPDPTKKSVGNVEINLPQCSVLPTGEGTINGCLAQIAYGFYELIAWIAGLFGELFDFFIGFSVSSASYNYPFVVTGWKLVRDISNIFFIIIMVYAGFSAVFDTNATSMKKLVPALILNAFLINFSLFATRAAIDLSNITARIFYSQMIVCDKANMDANGNCPAAQAKRDFAGFWPLSEKIVSSFNPQNMFRSSVLIDPRYQQGNIVPNNGVKLNTLSSQSAGTISADSDAREYANYFMIVCMIAAFIMIGVAIMFFNVTFLFLGRVIGLYVCMIFSPFAFLSRGGVVNIDRLKWDDWTKELLAYCMLAPIFVFFLYIIYTFLSSNFVTQIGITAINTNAASSSGLFGSVLTIVIPMLIIYFMIQAAQKTAKKYSGEIGGAIQGFVDKTFGNVAGVATGAVIGVATGGTSFLGTTAASFLQTSGETRTRLEARKAAGGISGKMAELQLKASDWTQKQTFDIRRTKGFQSAASGIGFNADSGLVGALGFGTKRSEGGREKIVKNAAKKSKDDVNAIKLDLTNEKAEEFWQNRIAKTAMKAYFDEQKKNAKTDAEKDALKKEKKDGSYVTNQAYIDRLAIEKAKSEAEYGEVKTNKKLTQALRRQYATTLKNEAVIGHTPAIDALRTLITGAAMPLAAPSILGVAATEDEGKRKGASEWLKEDDKNRKKAPRSERLEEESVSLGKQIKVMEDSLKDAYKDIAKNLTKRPENINKTAAEKAVIEENEITRLQNKDNAESTAVAINEFRELLRLQVQDINAKVRSADIAHKNALRAAGGDENTPLVQELLGKLSATIAEREVIRTRMSQIDLNKKRGLEDKRLKADGDLERIKEKEDNATKEAVKPKEEKKT